MDKQTKAQDALEAARTEYISAHKARLKADDAFVSDDAQSVQRYEKACETEGAKGLAFIRASIEYAEAMGLDASDLQEVESNKAARRTFLYRFTYELNERA